MTNCEPAAKMVLFTDLRHIRCGDLEWLSPEGKELPVAGPPEPEVEARPRTGFVPHGIRLVAQPAKKTEPLPKGSRFGRVIFESGTYRSWYWDLKYRPGENLGSYSRKPPQSVEICYSESEDAFEWKEEARCEIEVPGLWGFDGFTFFLDPKGPSDERYKVVYMAHPPREDFPSLWREYQKVHPRNRDLRLREDYISCMYAAASPDGIHWEAIREPLMVHKSDTDTSVYYDSWLDRYVMYTRLHWQERRWIGRAEAEDFRHWSPVEPLIWPSLDGPLSDDIYTNGRTEYPGQPGCHLMFPMVYHRYTQTSEVRLFSSADGICWNQVPGSPILSPGAPGDWDSEFIHAGKDLVPLGNEKVGVPYAGTSFPHKYPRWESVLRAGRRAWAWWPKGRICAVVADEEGEFFTFPMRPAGRQLRLNVRTRRAGEVRVGLVNVPGRSAADCDPVFGDGLTVPVHWRRIRHRRQRGRGSHGAFQVARGRTLRLRMGLGLMTRTYFISVGSIQVAPLQCSGSRSCRGTACRAQAAYPL